MRYPKPRWDANSVLSGTLLALLMTGYIALGYATTVAVAYLFFTPSDSLRAAFPYFQVPPWWLSGLAFAVIGVTVPPVGRWLRDHVDDLIYAQHDDPYVLIARVNAHLRAMSDPQATLPILAATIAQTLKLPCVAIETSGAESAWSCAFGTAPPGTQLTEIPVAYLDAQAGVLRACGRSAGRPLAASDLALLREAAQQLGMALRAAQLTADLRAARDRLVLAREEERRRVRNNLHDGLAPALSALQLQAGALRRLIRQEPARAETIADELGGDLRGLTGAIRELVYDLRPPMLDELKLVEAVRNLSFPGSGLRIDVQAPDPMPALPAAVEVAVYRIAAEALHNVVKHACATACSVRIEIAERRLALCITDDGRAPADGYLPGVGIHSMRERAAEVGGTLCIQPGANGGTQVIAEFPVQFEHG
jgi:two-component system NarL family sensor kinase